MELTDRVALITGGATGIGRATALALARGGAHIAVNFSRSAAEAEETVAEVRALGRRAIAVQANVADEPVVRAMVDRVVGEFGRLDIVVNSAGTTRFIPFEDLAALTDEIWQEIMQVNLMGAFYTARAAGPHLIAQRQGAIVNVASMAGVYGYGSSLPYAVSKGALITLTKALARVFAPHNVRVNAVAPGVVQTRWVAGQEAFIEQARQLTPLGRVALPEDVAHTIRYLVESDFIVGQVIYLDGGRTI